MDEGTYEEAIAEFDLALFSDGSMAAAFHNRALAEQRTGSLSSAIKDYARSIELDPELALAYQNRASAYLEAGGRQSALADLDHSLELDIGGCDEAIIALDRAIEIVPLIERLTAQDRFENTPYDECVGAMRVLAETEGDEA